MPMENDIREYLIRIATSIALFLLWAVTNVFIGIYLGWALFSVKPLWPNWLFYIFALATLILVIKHIIKKWKGVKMPEL